jgi:hypothetical protein
MGDFFNHPNKTIIRNFWCKPIIKGLYEILGQNLVYLGLPGLHAIDLVSWIEYLSYIIAIDCGHYSEKFNIGKARANIHKLNTILNRLERENKISGYSLYLGYIEEVVLKGLDRNGERFAPNKIVNIYNLDFCNSLTVPLKIVDLKGQITKYFKNEVIRKLLEFERDLLKPDHEKKFVMFITVHSNFWQNEAEQYFKSKNDLRFKEYSHVIDRLDIAEKTVRLLRMYFIDILKSHFTTAGFTPYFLPTIYYKGLGNNNLLCFTVVGKYVKLPSAIAPFNQDFDKLISEKFITPTHDKLEYLISTLRETNPNKDPIKLLDDSSL